MKYFTRGFYHGEYSDQEQDAVAEAYRSHIALLLPSIPSSLAVLAKTSLHDAVVRSVVVRARRSIIDMELVCHAPPDRQWIAAVKYRGVRLRDEGFAMLERRARDRRTEILNHEVDVDEDGECVHRLLFAPEGEITIWCDSIDVQQLPYAEWTHEVFCRCYVEECG
jgi:hypothetical protein